MTPHVLRTIGLLVIASCFCAASALAQDQPPLAPGNPDSLLGRRPSYAQGWMSYGDRLDNLETELAIYRDGGVPLEHDMLVGDETDSGDACPHCKSDCQCVCPGAFFSADYLNWKPRRRGLDFAIADPDTDIHVEGRVESLELESKSGLRTTFGYLTASRWDVAFTYTYFHSRDERSLTAPSGSTLWAMRTHPDALDSNEADSAAADATLKLHLYDLEAGRWFHPVQSSSLRLFGGIRLATIDQQWAIDYQGGNTLFNGHHIGQNTSMEGFGLRAGGEAHWYLRRRLSAFGRLAGSVLLGNFSSSYEEENSQDVDIVDEYFQTVPVTEVALGVNWHGGWLTVQAGYELAAWLNMSERVNFHGDGGFANESSLSNGSNDLGLDGYFIRLIATR
jgi:hypothetical protein